MHSDELTHLQRLTLTERQRLDLEQILCGAFLPLTGFLTEEEYDAVVSTMHLPSGSLWPMPIVLDVTDKNSYALGERLLLCDRYGYPVATFTVESAYRPDKRLEAERVYGTDDMSHPGVRYLMQETNDTYLGGPVELVAYAPAYDFLDLRLSPQETKRAFSERNWTQVVAFQTRNPIHRAHYELIRRAIDDTGANVLIHPVVGLTKEGDIDYVPRVRGYQHVVETYLKDRALLALLPLAMRMAGPREALWHALIRKNYGATHFIVGRDHAGMGATAAGSLFYEPFEAQRLAIAHEDELGIKIVSAPEMVFAANEKAYIPFPELKENDSALHISGSEFRRMLTSGAPVPNWFAFPEVINGLRARTDVSSGAVLFFTGLPSAGKTTIARLLYQTMLEQKVATQLLDGDVVRATYSRTLGFSRRDRVTNIKRIGAMAETIARCGTLAICAAVAPHEEARAANRKRMKRSEIPYIEIFVNTPLDVCEKRDRKGLYKKARAGNIKHFTGIDDAYEPPKNPEIVLDTESRFPEENANIIIDYLRSRHIL